MASAREYFKKKSIALKEEEYSRELGLHKRKRFLATIGVIGSVFCVLLVVFIYNKNRVYHDFDIMSEFKRIDDASTQYLSYNNNMVKYNVDGITCVDKNGDLIWNQTYEMKSPLVDVCGDYIVVCDDGGNKIYIFDGEGLQGEVETKLPIDKICTSAQGTVAALMSEEDINYIDYYNNNGKLIAENKAPVEKTGFPLDISLSDDGYKLAVSYMIIENASIETKLAFYNFDSVGENEIDHLVAAANYDGEIIPDVEFLTKDVAVVFGTEKWEIYEGTQKPKSIFSEKLKDEIKSVFYGDGNIGLVFPNQTTDYSYCMKIYNNKGKKILEQPFSFEYNNIFVKESYIYMYNTATLRIYNKRGKIIYEGSYEDELQNVIPISKTKIIMVFGNRVIYMHLK